MHQISNLTLTAARRLVWPLDPGAFRLFLAMLVFVHHFSSLDWGAYAVYVFFVLSGFWVQRIWTERYCRTRQPYWTYLVSRVWRLAPVMMLVSAITAALLLFIGISASTVFAANPLHLVFSSTFLIGYAWLAYAPVGSAWSLDIEMQYYLIAPLLALATARGWGKMLLLLAAACSLAWAWLAPAWLILPKYIAFFAAGLLSARHEWRPSARIAGVSAGITVITVAACLISPWRGILIGGSHLGPLHVFAPALNVVLAVLTIPFAIHTTSRPSDTADRMMADLSYIIYLLHWAAMQWFFQFASPFALRLGIAVTSFIVVPTASLVIWRYFDHPLNRARSAWVAARMIGPAAS